MCIRDREYCTEACKQRAYRKRKRELAGGDGDDGDDGGDGNGDGG